MSISSHSTPPRAARGTPARCPYKNSSKHGCARLGWPALSATPAAVRSPPHAANSRRRLHPPKSQAGLTECDVEPAAAKPDAQFCRGGQRLGHTMEGKPRRAAEDDDIPRCQHDVTPWPATTC